MKINTADHILKQMPGLSPVRKTGPDGSAFANALGRALTATAPDQTPAPAAAPGPASISGIQFTGIPASLQATAAKKVDRLLDLLEGYQQQLADPRQSLKSIAPQLERMEKGTRDLEKAIEKLDDSDALKSIAQEALVTVTAEVFKFNRGDFIPA